MRRWLAEHFARVADAVLAVCVVRHRQRLAESDLMMGRAVYELGRPFSECAKVLDQLPEVAEDNLAQGERSEGFADARAWLDPSEVTGEETGTAVLGRVLLRQSHWRLEAFGAASLEQLRCRFEAQLGDRVRFTSQRLDDLAVELAEKQPQIDESLVPPRQRQQESKVIFTVDGCPIPSVVSSKICGEWRISRNPATSNVTSDPVRNPS